MMSAAQATRPGTLRAWVLAARPATLLVGVVPVVVGAAVARALGALRVGPVLAALVGAMLIQVGTNFANDVFDYEKGADTPARVGPLRVTQAGLIAPETVRLAMFVCFGLATLAGAYLAWVAGPAIVIVGLLSIASGIAYTGGPWPLGYNGLGDLFVFVFFGFVAVCGTTFVSAGTVPALGVFVSVPVGALATAVLVVNNLRDRETDATCGKRTLVVRFGRRFGVGEYLALVGAAYATPPVVVLLGLVGPWALLPMTTLPFGVALSYRVARSHGAALNPYLGKTAALLLAFGVLAAVGIARR